MRLNVNQAFILAGGKGERLLPLTANKPKVLLKVKGKPILQWNIELARAFGIQEIILGVGHLHEQIQAFFGNGKKFGIKIQYSIEKDFLGTAGALKEAERFFENEKKLVMMNGDEVKEIDFLGMNALFKEKKADSVIALTKVKDVSQFGSVQLEGNRIKAFLEKSVSSQNENGLINAGAYLLSNRVLKQIPANEKVSIEKQVFPWLAKSGKLFGFKNQGQWFPTDTLQKLEKARKNWRIVFKSK